MSPLRLCCIVGIAAALGACSSYEPRANPWPERRIEIDAPEPRPLPAWPRIGEDLKLTAEQASQLLDFADTAEANAEIARELSTAVETLSESRNDLVEMGNAEHELAELRARLLEEERAARLWDKIMYGALAILGIAVGH